MEDQIHILGELENSGLAKPHEANAQQWVLTAKGKGLLSSTLTLQENQLLFQVRDSVPLHDRTPFELMITLANNGWEWGYWIPPSRRTKALMDAFPDYVPDGPKKYYSNAVTSSVYLQVLLKSVDLFSAGLKSIPHDRKHADYNELLLGKFSILVPAIEDDMPLDIEAPVYAGAFEAEGSEIGTDVEGELEAIMEGMDSGASGGEAGDPPDPPGHAHPTPDPTLSVISATSPVLAPALDPVWRFRLVRVMPWYLLEYRCHLSLHQYHMFSRQPGSGFSP